MPDKVKYEQEFDIIRVESVGIITEHDTETTRDKIAEIHKETNCTHVLMDVSEVVSPPSSTEIFEFIAKWKDRSKIAMLKGKHIASSVNFLETVGFNRGFEIKAFEEENQALTWLKDH